MRRPSYSRLALLTSLLVAAPIGVLAASCDRVIGIEDVKPGIPCKTADDCVSSSTGGSADPCLVGRCEKEVCVIANAADGVACGDHGEACAAGSCGCPADHACGPNGACVDVERDKEHCGGCAHSCMDAPCFQGVCDPTTIATEPDQEGFFTALTQDTSNIYFVAYNYVDPDPTAVRSIGKSDLALTTIASLPTNSCVYGAAPVNGNIYFSEAGCTSDTTIVGNVLYAPLVPGMVQTLVTGNYATGVQNVGSELYWFESGRLVHYPLPAGPSEVIAPSDVTAFKPTPTAIYYLQLGQLVRDPIMPMNGETSTVLATDIGKREGDPPFNSAVGILVNDAYVYVLVTPTDAEIKDGIVKGQLLRVPVTGGAPEVLVSHLLQPTAFGLDEKYVYYGDYSQRTIHRIPLVAAPGTEGELFATGFACGSIILDDTYAYMGDDTHSAIVRVPK